jgi:hypothetical protein
MSEFRIGIGAKSVLNTPKRGTKRENQMTDNQLKSPLEKGLICSAEREGLYI